MKKLISLCALCVLTNAAVIKEIKFNGLTQLSLNSAINITNLKIGDDIDLNKINTAILNLYRQNYFSNIKVDENDGVISFNVEEKPSIAKVTIVGIATNDRKALEQLIGLNRGNLYDINSINDAVDRIKGYYQAKGFFDTVVAHNTKKLENTNSIELEFIINRGENIIINKVTLNGAKNFKYSTIEPELINKEREFMGWMWGRNDGKLQIFELNNDASRISDEYMKKGYLDVKVSAPYLRTHTDNYTAELNYFINEGAQYKITDILIENSLFSEEENARIAKKELKSSVGKIINIEKVRADVKYIETISADLGYAFVNVMPDIQKDEASKEARIVFRVITNNKVYIRNVIIAGNSRTNDRVIRRDVYVTEGQLYNRSDVNDSRNALRRTSYFDDVEIKEERVDENQVDLIINVTEASTGAISGGIGYSTSGGMLLNASLSDSNIFGSGYKSYVRVDKDDDTLTGRIGLINPRINDSLYSLGSSVYATDYDWTNYSERSYGFDVTLGRQFARYFNAGLTYNWEHSNIYALSPDLILTGYRLGKSTKSSLTPSISFNNTDDYYLPRSGIIASTAFEFAGVGGSQKFFHSASNFNLYQGLQDYIGWDLIFRYKTSFHKVWDRGYLPINQRLYLGGIDNMRGFETKTLSPRNAWGHEIGGTASLLNSFELSFPIIDRIKLRGAVFFDYGMIGETSLNEIKRMSTGVGLEWITPIGPLQLVFAKPLNDKQGDKTSSFEFNLGARF